MRSTGVRRKLDDLGRVVIPAGIRRSLDLQDGDAIEFTVHGDRIIMSRATDRCVVCGHQGEGLREIRGRRMCESCIREVAALREAQEDREADDEREAEAAGDAASDDEGRIVPLSRSVEEESADLAELRREAYDPASTTAW